MNTTALPFSDSHYGSLWAIGLAAVAAGLVFGYRAASA
jgi:Mg2+ and Co2+ transporter CorA